MSRTCSCKLGLSSPRGILLMPVILQGQRALDFVLKNKGLIDKTLLFDIELVRVGS